MLATSHASAPAQQFTPLRPARRTITATLLDESGPERVGAVPLLPTAQRKWRNVARVPVPAMAAPERPSSVSTASAASIAREAVAIQYRRSDRPAPRGDAREFAGTVDAIGSLANAAGARQPSRIDAAAAATPNPPVRTSRGSVGPREGALPAFDSAAVDRLADDVLRRIERKLRIERERRGL